jgi:hypothetical protein
MTPEERLDWIDRLQREAAEGRERIAELQRRRLEDPFAYDLADYRFTQEAGDFVYAAPTEPLEGRGARHTRRIGGEGGLVYRMTENAPAPAPPPAGAPSSDEGDWRDAVAEGIAIACEALRHEIERELTVLRNENRELKGMLSAALQLLGGAGQPKSGSASIVELPNWRRRRDVA